MEALHAPLAALDPAPFRLPPEMEQALSPAFCVFLDAVRHNVSAIQALCGGPERWRPHVKTTKIPEVWALLARAGQARFKAATTREAALLLQVLEREGVRGADVLLAYPLLGPALERLGAIVRAHPDSQVSVLCESAQIAAAAPPELGLYVDLNPGMNRTGVPEGDTPSLRAIARAAGERLRGLHFYDGHLHQADRDERRRVAHAGYERLLELRALVEAEGARIRELVTSGTPSFPHALEFEPFDELADCVHRVSPGTVVFHDGRTEQDVPELPLLPAAQVMARVVSHPAPGIATCDAGSKSIAAEAGDPCAFVLGRPGLVARTPNEEHLPLEVRDGERPERGEVLQLVPRHVCPTTNLAEEAVLIEDGRVLDVVPVAARAHELFAAGAPSR